MEVDMRALSVNQEHSPGHPRFPTIESTTGPMPTPGYLNGVILHIPTSSFLNRKARRNVESHQPSCKSTCTGSTWSKKSSKDNQDTRLRCVYLQRFYASVFLYLTHAKKRKKRAYSTMLIAKRNPINLAASLPLCHASYKGSRQTDQQKPALHCSTRLSRQASIPGSISSAYLTRPPILTLSSAQSDPLSKSKLTVTALTTDSLQRMQSVQITHTSGVPPPGQWNGHHGYWARKPVPPRSQAASSAVSAAASTAMPSRSASTSQYDAETLQAGPQAPVYEFIGFATPVRYGPPEVDSDLESLEKPSRLESLKKITSKIAKKCKKVKNYFSTKSKGLNPTNVLKKRFAAHHRLSSTASTLCAPAQISPVASVPTPRPEV
ncbi:hypothetical protein QBC46DRAFT_409602 [Diplogelasinospora grovesii]|uniref:Uncharacterized protein n=1 Tax=Diplogelasinospora grovesii TaxID=303347 RepID=A0AAN6N4G3_9PEZI|nr:hypothetical protein QBC46DRAFT_409602 [Diplogelasinospora grovesii]